MRPLSPLEARVLGVLVEKQSTVPDTYPLSLNALVAGCNQKTARSPVIEATEAEVLVGEEQSPVSVDVVAGVGDTRASSGDKGLIQRSPAALRVCTGQRARSAR